jgi:chromosome segregation ATPase
MKELAGSVGRVDRTLSDVRSRVAKGVELVEDVQKLLQALVSQLEETRSSLRRGLEGVDRKLRELEERSRELGERLERWGESLRGVVESRSKSELEALEKGFGDLQERVRLVGAAVSESGNKVLEGLDAARKDLGERLGKLAEEVNALHKRVGELAALFEEARLELLHALDSLAHLVETYKDAALLKSLEAV